MKMQMRRKYSCAHSPSSSLRLHTSARLSRIARVATPPAAAIFAQFVLDQFGASTLGTGTVLDVAAGAGRLSAALSELYAAQGADAATGRNGEDEEGGGGGGGRGRGGSSPLRCTLVEPTARKETVLATGCALVTEHFDEGFAARHVTLMRDCSILIGLHPDEATEAIVDMALAHGKPFAIVPCCVYPTLFPGRRLHSGQSVRTYRGLVHYLKAKHPDVETARLPFEGRNRVLFMRGGSASRSQPDAPVDARSSTCGSCSVVDLCVDRHK